MATVVRQDSERFVVIIAEKLISELSLRCRFLRRLATPVKQKRLYIGFFKSLCHLAEGNRYIVYGVAEIMESKNGAFLGA